MNGPAKARRDAAFADACNRALADDHEWRFGMLKDHELEDAWQWEISREQARQANGGTFPENPQKTPATASDRRRFRFGDSTPRWWHANPDWPAKSYRKAMHKGASQSIGPHPLDEADLHKRAQSFARSGPPWPLDYFDREPGSPWETVAFDLDWRTGDCELKKQFANWLRSRRPKSEFPPDPPRVPKPRVPNGAGAPKRQAATKLKKLAVWRLVKTYGLSQAQVLKFNKERGLALYDAKEKVSQAVSFIEKELKKVAR